MPTPAPAKKLRVGWFSFTCCEDSTIVFTELLNDHWQDWKRLIDFRHARVLQTKNVMDEMDVAFVEGAISSDKHIAKLKTIREKAKVLVAIGACACIGKPSDQRNDFDPARKAEIQAILDRFAYLPKVLKLSDVVTVDASVPGCPMDPNMFLKLLDKTLVDFGITVPANAPH